MSSATEANLASGLLDKCIWSPTVGIMFCFSISQPAIVHAISGHMLAVGLPFAPEPLQHGLMEEYSCRTPEKRYSGLSAWTAGDIFGLPGSDRLKKARAGHHDALETLLPRSPIIGDILRCARCPVVFKTMKSASSVKSQNNVWQKWKVFCSDVNCCNLLLKF